jgi:Arc/MetJ-type ribon-helix-helix transcriptional regulator
MNIRLTSEQEAIIQDELKSGHFHSVEEVIGEALQSLRERDRSLTTGMPGATQSEAVCEMIAFVETHHTRLEGISVKELIHQGHRL